MTRLLLVEVFMLLTFLHGCAIAIEPPRSGQQNFLSRAVFADGRVWLLSDAGELSTVTEKANARVPSGLSDPVLDVCVTDGKLKAVTSPSTGQPWTIRAWDDGKWFVGAAVQARGDEFIAFGCSSLGDLILTSQRIIEFAGSQEIEHRLSEKLYRATTAAVHLTQDYIYVGSNAGEWGGGLERIDRRDGKVTALEKNMTGKLCSGPLNQECDPVNAIITSPWKPACVVAAIGLVHFSPHGRLVEVCGDDIRRIYFKPFQIPRGYPKTKRLEEGEEEPFETVAFFGLASNGTSLIAAGIDGVHRITSDGTGQVTPLPKFRDIGGIGISFDDNDVILVLTMINQRRSISGNVPLLVPRPSGPPNPALKTDGASPRRLTP